MSNLFNPPKKGGSKKSSILKYKQFYILYLILTFIYFVTCKSDLNKDKRNSIKEETVQVEKNQIREEQGLNFPDDTWQHATPESQGINSKLLKQALLHLNNKGKPGCITVIRNGFIIGSHGDITRPFKVGIFSVSKSLIALIGARLIQEGKISLDTEIPLSNNAPVAGKEWDISVFKDGTPHPTSLLANYRHFMSMTSDFGLEKYKPGNHFSYNNNAIHFYGTHMNRTYYENVDPVLFLERGLFNYLGGYQDTITFTGEYGGWDGGWAISSRDLARTGLLMLAQGKWNGTQIIPAHWVKLCFENQIPANAIANEDKGPNTRWNQQRFTYDLKGRYSFGWWLHDLEKKHGNEAYIAASGRGGNLILILPDVKMIISVVNDEVEPNKRPAAEDYVKEIRSAIESNNYIR